MATRLSENRVGGDYIGTRSSNNSDFTYCSSAAAMAMARYSALVEDRATVRCFIELHEIGLTPRNMRKALVELRSSELLAQPSPEKLFNV